MTAEAKAGVGKPIEPRVIGDHIRRLRVEHGLSVRAFAAQTGFSASFISQLENGQVTPSLGSLQKIAETLEVTLGEFFAATTGEAEDDLVVHVAERRRLDSTWTDAHLEALGSMTFRATRDLTLEGQNVAVKGQLKTEIEAGVQASFKAKLGVTVDGGLSSTIKGATLTLKGISSFSP